MGRLAQQHVVAIAALLSIREPVARSRWSAMSTILA
jgi:hypothetical protein